MIDRLAPVALVLCIVGVIWPRLGFALGVLLTLSYMLSGLFAR